LHPVVRIAYFKGKQWDADVLIRARPLLLDIMKQYTQADGKRPATDVAESSDSGSIPHTTIFGMAMALNDTPAANPVSAAADGKAEVNLYCGNICPVGLHFDDPLGWWQVSFSLLLVFSNGIDPLCQENAGTLIFMAHAARDILAIPGVSISVERLFRA
jgi:hypothetical protein